MTAVATQGTNQFLHDIFQGAHHGTLSERFFHRARLRTIASFIPYFRGRVLDFGCNTGLVLLDLARRGLQIAGTDINPEHLRRAAQYVAQTGFAADLYPCEALTPHAFSTVLLNNVLEYVQDQPALVRRISRELLTPEAVVLLSIANPNHLVIRFAWIRALLSSRRADEIGTSEPLRQIGIAEGIAWFEAEGFRVVKRRAGLLFVEHYALLVREGSHVQR